MKVYFDVCDVPDRFFGWVEGHVLDGNPRDIGSPVDLGLERTGTTGEDKIFALQIEAIVPSSSGYEDRTQYKLTTVTFGSRSEAIECIDMLESTGRFQFFKFE